MMKEVTIVFYESKRMKRFARALLIGLCTSLGAFAAIAAALWGPAGLKLSHNAYIWLAAGSVLPGIVAFFLELRASKDRLDATADRERSESLRQTVEKEVKRAVA